LGSSQRYRSTTSLPTSIEGRWSGCYSVGLVGGRRSSVLRLLFTHTILRRPSFYGHLSRNTAGTGLPRLTPHATTLDGWQGASYEKTLICVLLILPRGILAQTRVPAVHPGQTNLRGRGTKQTRPRVTQPSARRFPIAPHFFMREGAERHGPTNLNSVRTP